MASTTSSSTASDDAVDGAGLVQAQGSDVDEEEEEDGGVEASACSRWLRSEASGLLSRESGTESTRTRTGSRRSKRASSSSSFGNLLQQKITDIDPWSAVANPRASLPRSQTQPEGVVVKEVSGVTALSCWPGQDQSLDRAGVSLDFSVSTSTSSLGLHQTKIEQPASTGLDVDNDEKKQLLNCVLVSNETKVDEVVMSSSEDNEVILFADDDNPPDELLYSVRTSSSDSNVTSDPEATNNMGPLSLLDRGQSHDRASAILNRREPPSILSASRLSAIGGRSLDVPGAASALHNLRRTLSQDHDTVPLPAATMDNNNKVFQPVEIEAEAQTEVAVASDPLTSYPKRQGIVRQARCDEPAAVTEADTVNANDEEDSVALLPTRHMRPSKLAMPMQRARSLTLPSRNEDRCPLLRSPMRNCPAAITEESVNTNDSNDCLTIHIDSGEAISTFTNNGNRPTRVNSLDNGLFMNIPTFTVTINPLEDDEITFVPDSPTLQCPAKTCHVSTDDGNGNSTLLNDEEELRRSSIGSASSLALDDNCLGVPRTLEIRRVSEISHINELRREVSGMEHLASEYYELKRESNADNISLDTIHKTVFKRCQNKYMPPERSTTQNKCFVIITSGFTILGIIYGFWYKNFGPGSH